MDPRKNEASSSATIPKSIPKLPSTRSSPIPSSSCCQCNTSLGYRYVDSDDEPSGKTCLPPCYSPYFADEQSKSLMNMWLTFLSFLCAISCAFVILTFFLDITRFKYPQRPIIFLALCYFFVSCGYLIRLALGHENVACRLENKVSQSNERTNELYRGMI